MSSTEKKVRKLFGTDGIRGKANAYPMTSEVATALGRAVTFYFQSRSAQKQKKPLIIVGKDTRLSCYMLELAFASGVCSQGGQVILTGPLPTPGVAFVTKSMRAEAGVMISASHNPYDDNGIKIFDADGFKLPDEVELELEQLTLNPQAMPKRLGPDLGNAKRLKEVYGRYIVHVKSSFSDDYDLEDLRIVLDCANGAGYKVAPMIFRELGAEVFTVGVSPNGQNINLKCGSTSPYEVQDSVKKYRADIGLCLDGDGDRVIVVDQDSKIIDGDQVIGLLAKMYLDQGLMRPGDEVVGTVMSNLGLEHYINSLGLKFFRTKVGDRYIAERMREVGAVLGGEPSGHLILKPFSTTGDGALAGLKLVEALKFYKKTIEELVSPIALYPQKMINVRINQSKKVPFESSEVIQNALKSFEQKLGDSGRILLRYSGTEPLARVMVEGADSDLVDKICEELSIVVENELT